MKTIFELVPIAHRMPRWIRFVAAGITTALVQLVVLYILADRLGMYYLSASTIAFIVALGTNFVLQKNWTFEDREQGRAIQKLTFFFAISGVNLLLNVAGMYLLVDVAMLWHMFAQCVMMGVLAVMNYFLYGMFVFRAEAR